MLEQATLVRSDAAAHGNAEAARLAVLRLLQQRPDLSQRELSEALGLSLGKTHYVLHSLLDRGLVKAGNFRRSGNKLAYAYMLPSPRATKYSAWVRAGCTAAISAALPGMAMGVGGRPRRV